MLACWSSKTSNQSINLNAGVSVSIICTWFAHMGRIPLIRDDTMSDNGQCPVVLK